jgi:hypothetical protein
MGGVISPITVSANWGSDTGAQPVTSAIRTLTVPAGNPGNIQFTRSPNAGFFDYKKNGGGAVGITHGDTISVANGDTLQFIYTSASPPENDTLTVTDVATATAVGTYAADATS